MTSMLKIGVMKVNYVVIVLGKFNLCSLN